MISTTASLLYTLTTKTSLVFGSYPWLREFWEGLWHHPYMARLTQMDNPVHNKFDSFRTDELLHSRIINPLSLMIGGRLTFSVAETIIRSRATKKQLLMREQAIVRKPRQLEWSQCSRSFAYSVAHEDEITKTLVGQIKARENELDRTMTMRVPKRALLSHTTWRCTCDEGI